MRHASLAVLLGCLSFAACASLSPSPAQGADAEVAVVRSESGNQVDTTFAAFSFEKSHLTTHLFEPGNQGQVALFKRLGPGILRIGANQVDHTSWDHAGKGLDYPTIAPSDVDRLAAFLRACDWKVIYAVGHARNTPRQAADEAAYAAKALGDRLVAIEIGNEPDLYKKKPDHPERPRPADWPYKDFKAEWEAIADAVTQAVPGVRIVGPSCAGEGQKENGWTKDFAKDEGSRLLWLTQHYYITGAKKPQATVENMVKFPEPQLEKMLAHMDGWCRSNGIKGFHLDEVNTYYGGGTPGVSDSHGSALWAVNYLFTCAQCDTCRGVALHTGNSPYSPFHYDNQVGHKKGGSSANLNENVAEVRPEYYGIAFFNLAARGKVQKTWIAGHVPGNALAAYAVAATDGAIHVVLVNSGARALTVDVDLAAKTTQATLLSLTGPSLSSTGSTRLGGAAIGIDGGWKPEAAAPVATPDGHLTVAVPAFGAVLVQAR